MPEGHRPLVDAPTIAMERAERRFSTGLRLNVSLCGFGFIMGFLLHRVRLTARQIGSRYLQEAHERNAVSGFERIIPLLHHSSNPFYYGNTCQRWEGKSTAAC